MKIKLNTKTISHFKKTKNGYIPKIKFNSYYEANKECNRINILQSIEFKVIPYHCNVCNKIHIGKDVKVLNDLNKEVLNSVEAYSLNYN
jgi:hypothetical protein